MGHPDRREQYTKYELNGINVTDTFSPSISVASSTSRSKSPFLHMHEYLQMFYVDYGTLTHHIFGMQYRMVPGEISLVPIMQPHNIDGRDSYYKTFGCDIRTDVFTGIDSANPWGFDSICLTPLSVTAKTKTPFFIPSHMAQNKLRALFDECEQLSIENDPCTFLLLRGKTVEMFSLIAGDFSEREYRLIGSKMSDYCMSLYHAMNYIHTNFRDKLSVEGIAKEAMLHERTLYRLFNGCMDISILQYMNYLRIQHAKNLLAKTDRIISAISADSGFSHTANFHRLFLHDTGMSPGQYRELKQAK